MFSFNNRRHVARASLLSLFVILTAAILPYAHCHETALHGRILTPHHPPCAQSIGHLFLLPGFGDHEGDDDAAKNSHDHCIHFLTEDAGIGSPVPSVEGPTEATFLPVDGDPLPYSDLRSARADCAQKPYRPIDGFQTSFSGLSPPLHQIII